MNRHKKTRLDPERVIAALVARNLEPNDLASSRVGSHKLDRRTINTVLKGEEITVFSANKIASALGTSISSLQLGEDENSSFSTTLKINHFESMFPFTPFDHVNAITPSSFADHPDFFKYFDRRFFWNDELYQGRTLWLKQVSVINKTNLIPIERKDMCSVATPMTASGLSNVMDLHERPKFTGDTIQARMDERFSNTYDSKPIFKSLPEVHLSKEALEGLEQLNAFLYEEDGTSSDLSSFIAREKKRMMIGQLLDDLKNMDLHILGAQVGTWLMSHWTDPYEMEAVLGLESARWTRPILVMAPWSIKECSITYPTDALWQKTDCPF